MLILVIYLTFLSIVSSRQTLITVSPVNKVVSGSKVTFICEVNDAIAPILWQRNGISIGEDCNIYMKSEKFECLKESNKYTLHINSVAFEEAGEWSCSHLIHKSNVNLEVFVPISVENFTISTDYENNNLLQSKSLRLTKGPIKDLSVKNKGTKLDPIDLTNNNSPNKVTIQCKSSCTSPGNALRMIARNSTWKDNLDSKEITMNDEGCPKGLVRHIQLIDISCENDEEVGSLPSGNERLSLIGLNRVSCLADNTNLDSILQKSKFHKTSSNLDDQLILLSQELGVNVNSELSASQLYRLRASRYSPECLNSDGKNLGSCVYILCPAKRVTEYFTFGEKIALGVAAFLIFILIIFIIHISRVQKKSKRKDYLIQRQNNQNHIPSIYQDIQLML